MKKILVLFIFAAFFAQPLMAKHLTQGAAVPIVTADNFDQFLSKDKVSVLDVYATWCSPCKKFGPIFDEVSKEYKNVNFAKMNYDASPDLAKDLGVTNLPTVLFFRPGETTPSYSFVGLMSKEEFKGKIEDFLGQ